MYYSHYLFQTLMIISSTQGKVWLIHKHESLQCCFGDSAIIFFLVTHFILFSLSLKVFKIPLPTRLFFLTFITLFIYYSVAVARSRDVPAFGPPIPEGVNFPKSSVFRDFLLTKVINAENAAHKSDKFRAMATRTRHEYLRDLAERHVTSTPIDPSGKFPFISLAHKRKEKSRPYSGAELRSPGSITWPVYTEDHSTGGELEALLGISNDFLILVDPESKAVVFNCAVRDVIGWTLGSPASMKIFYERGENISLRSVNNNTEDFREVVKRLEVRDEAVTRLALCLY